MEAWQVVWQLELLNVRRLALELKACNDEQGKVLERMDKLFGEMRADQKAQGMIATSTVLALPHL
jgi:hypothetical protein